MAQSMKSKQIWHKNDKPSPQIKEDFKISGPNRYIVPFLACGDLSAYDSDKSYPLNLGDGSEYKYHEPVQKPIDPPYKTAIAERRGEDIEKKLEECDINQK